VWDTVPRDLVRREELTVTDCAVSEAVNVVEWDFESMSVPVRLE
jgi:hypothetical protein